MNFHAVGIDICAKKLLQVDIVTFLSPAYWPGLRLQQSHMLICTGGGLSLKMPSIAAKCEPKLMKNLKQIKKERLEHNRSAEDVHTEAKASPL